MKIAVIPARGGSKRIPRKNIRLFAGKPLIKYSIDTALTCGLFDLVMVSTDDEEIAAMSRMFGAQVPFMRPANLADDFTGTGAVVKHAIQWLMDDGKAITHACCIYATAPFLQPSFLQQGYEKLVAHGKSYSFSITSFAFPIQRALRITSDGDVEPIHPEHRNTRSQDLEEAFHDAGQFYWGTAEAFLNEEPIFSHASTPIVLPRYMVQDIDTLEDWQRAELMYKAWQLSGACPA